ncbi:MAG: hypothetical protein Fur0012_05660 [Elusimicrobiota bacterium]
MRNDFLLSLLIFSHTLIFASPLKPVHETFFDRLMKEQSDMDLVRGARLMEESRYREAAVEFAKAVDKNPSSNAFAMYGAALYWLGDIDGSIQQYEEALKKDPKNAIAWQLKGISKARKGLGDEALENFLKALELEPRRSDINMNIGSIYFSRGFMSSALSYMKSAVKYEPSNPLYIYQLGLVYFYLERYQDAEECFSAALSRSYDYEEAALWLGLTMERQGNKKGALKNYLKAISLRPGDFFARYKAARLLSSSGKEKEAVSQIASSFLIRRSHPDSGLSLFIAYGGKGETLSAGELKKFSNPNLDQIYKNLIKAPCDEELSFSVDIISTPAMTLEKKDEKLSSALKRSSAMKKRYSGKSLTLPPSNPQEREKAISSALSSIDKEALLNDPSYNHKINFYMSSSKPAAEKKSVAVYSPRDVGNQMGLWVYGNNWLDVLSEDIESFSNLPASPLDSMIRGLAFLLYGEGEESIDFFKKAEKNYPREALLGMASARVSLGQEKEACELLEKALKLAPGDYLIKENLKWLKNGK